MNINEWLIYQTEPFLPKYDCSARDFQDVLLSTVPFEERQQRAIHFINGILGQHGKQSLLSQVADLATVEQGIRDLLPGIRDHVVHAVRVFLLGIFFNETILKEDPVDPFQWKVAGLTHDVGYPFEISNRIGSPFGNKLNAISRNLGDPSHQVRFRASRLEGLENLKGGRNSLDLIQARLNDWGIAIDVNRVFQEKTQESSVCHGVISALAVLWVIDLLYSKVNPNRRHETMLIDGVDWNEDWFEKDNVSACSAIFLHNLDLPWFDNSRISRGTSSVAYLLRLADTLQEWERPSGSIPYGLPADMFEMEIAGHCIVYRTNMANKERLLHVLNATLTDHNIQIE